MSFPHFLSQINSASISFAYLWFQDTPPKKTPLGLKMWIFKLLQLPCCWSSKRMSCDNDRSWKGMGLILLLSSKKTSKTCQNIHIFDWFDHCWKLLIFSNVSDEWSYQFVSRHTFRATWNFTSVESFGGGQGGKIWGKKMCFGYPEIIGEQMRYWLN